MEKQFRRYYEEANRQPGKTGENLLQILESRLDNVVYRAGPRPHPAAWPASWSATATSWSTARRSTSRSYRVVAVRHHRRQGEVAGHAARSRSPRETAGDRPIPAWLQVVAERLRILVHQLPERAQIDMPLTEQLIVEFYSK